MAFELVSELYRTVAIISSTGKTDRASSSARASNMLELVSAASASILRSIFSGENKPSGLIEIKDSRYSGISLRQYLQNHKNGPRWNPLCESVFVLRIVVALP